MWMDDLAVDALMVPYMDKEPIRRRCDEGVCSRGLEEEEEGASLPLLLLPRTPPPPPLQLHLVVFPAAVGVSGDDDDDDDMTNIFILEARGTVGEWRLLSLLLQLLSRNRC